MKKLISLLLALALVLPAAAAFAAVPGEAVGDVLYTDVVATIDGFPIRSYNIAGETYVVVEDLADYGFSVSWLPDEGKLVIDPVHAGTPDTYTAKYVPEKNTHPAGTPAMKYLYTEITTWIGKRQIVGYNIGGFTCCRMDDLAEAFAETYVWDPAAITLNMTTKRPPETAEPETPLVLPEAEEKISGDEGTPAAENPSNGTEQASENKPAKKEWTTEELFRTDENGRLPALEEFMEELLREYKDSLLHIEETFNDNTHKIETEEDLNEFLEQLNAAAEDSDEEIVLLIINEKYLQWAFDLWKGFAKRFIYRIMDSQLDGDTASLTVAIRAMDFINAYDAFVYYMRKQTAEGHEFTEDEALAKLQSYLLNSANYQRPQTFTLHVTREDDALYFDIDEEFVEFSLAITGYIYILNVVLFDEDDTIQYDTTIYRIKE